MVVEEVFTVSVVDEDEDEVEAVVVVGVVPLASVDDVVTFTVVLSVRAAEEGEEGDDEDEGEVLVVVVLCCSGSPSVVDSNVEVS